MVCNVQIDMSETVDVEDQTGQSDADPKKVLQPWKLIVIAALALPVLLIDVTGFTAGSAAGQAVGMVVMFYIATLTSRRVGLSDRVRPLVWKITSATSALVAISISIVTLDYPFTWFGGIYPLVFLVVTALMLLYQGSSRAVKRVR